MLKNNLKIAGRSIFANKTSSFINITGLSVGMAVAILIGLWIWDELSFNKYHENYDRIAQVMESDTQNGSVNTGAAIPLPLGTELRKNYGDDFKHIVISSWTDPHVLSVGDKNISYRGTFMTAEAPEMFTLRMRKGSRNGLQGRSSILIAQSVATALFGDTDAMDKLIRLDNKTSFRVTGVYEDLPENTTLHDVAFLAPWDYYQATPDGHRAETDWADNSLFIYVQLADHAEMTKLSARIKDVKLKNTDPATARLKPQIFLQPMYRWHLYSTFKNGVNSGGAIQYVWLFGTIGIIALLLACINFMNLCTARSEKRAKEVGIRKAIGSRRSQLINQFFSESLLIAFLAFALSLILVSAVLPFFNGIAGKKITIDWVNPYFWAMNIAFTFFTGMIAGSYPALYLSSFNPVRVLKGTFRAGRFASLPRRILVVVQFSASVILIIGTVIVFKQIQFAKNRPVGYSREGLINIEATNSELHDHFDLLRDDLMKCGAITGIAESSSPATGINNNRDDLEWLEKDPAVTYEFGNIRVTSEYGKTIGWEFKEGRDFSSQLPTDSSSLIVNEAAVKYMGLKNPLGEIVRFRHREHKIIGIVKDMIMGSPYEPTKPTVFYLSGSNFDNLIIRINPQQGTHEALGKIAAVCKTWSPAVPFSCKFVDDEYAAKFRNEERIGQLSNFFAVLAIFISCLGLFGMASFVAEQRKREIGIRKVLGASVFNLWRMLSSDFVLLVLIACIIAGPVAWFFLHAWLQNYEYRTGISWWIFGVAAAGALVITLLTVSFQSIKAAVANPVKSLRTE